MLDQTRLPGEEVDAGLPHVARGGRRDPQLAIRGAPAIGIAGAMAWRWPRPATAGRRSSREVGPPRRGCAASRPTAVNLAWAVDGCEERLAAAASSGRGAGR